MTTTLRPPARDLEPRAADPGLDAEVPPAHASWPSTLRPSFPATLPSAPPAPRRAHPGTPLRRRLLSSPPAPRGPRAPRDAPALQSRGHPDPAAVSNAHGGKDVAIVFFFFFIVVVRIAAPRASKY